MTFRAILPLLALLALLATPLRMFAGEAAAAPHHGAQAGASEHCPPPAEAPEEGQPASSIDCMMACAGMTAGDSSPAGPASTPRPVYARSSTSFFAGTSPGSDPPPPRLA